MKITPEQLNFLNSFSCERLSASKENETLAAKFTNARAHPSVINNFQHKAWSEDKQGHLAYYVIKNAKHEIILFFAIQCGALFTPIDEQNNLALARKYEFIKNTFGKETLEMLLHIPDVCIWKKEKELKDSLQADIQKDCNPHTQRVFATYSGIELALYYMNTSYIAQSKNYWQEKGIVHTIGTVLFWHHIVPIIQNVKKYIGCRYLFLFAADDSNDGTLLNYYSNLGFEDRSDVGTNKPIFDLSCKFMYQEISDMENLKNIFFENFNPDEKEPI